MGFHIFLWIFIFLSLEGQYPNVADRRLFLSTPSRDAVFEIWSVTIYFFLGLLVVYFFNASVAKSETSAPKSIEPTNLLLNFVLIILIFRMGVAQAYPNTYPALLFIRATELIPCIFSYISSFFFLYDRRDSSDTFVFTGLRRFDWIFIHQIYEIRTIDNVLIRRRYHGNFSSGRLLSDQYFG